MITLASAAVVMDVSAAAELLGLTSKNPSQDTVRTTQIAASNIFIFFIVLFS